MSDFVDACLAAPAGVSLLAALEGAERGHSSFWDPPDDVSPAAVRRAIEAIESMPFGRFCSVAVAAAESYAGPWTSDAPARLATCYQSAHDRRPIAEAIAKRFGDDLHAPFDSTAQQWWMSDTSALPGRGRRLFQSYDQVYGNGEFTRAGLWTATDPDPAVHDDLVNVWEIYPGPVGRWQLPVAADARIYTIDDPKDYVSLVTEYPATATGTNNGWELPGPNHWTAENARLAEASQHCAAIDTVAAHYVPDWAAVARDFDGVHLSWAGFITTEGRVSTTPDGGVAMLRYWFSERTSWLADVFGEPIPLVTPELSGRIGGYGGIDVTSDQTRQRSDRAYLETLLGRR